MSIAFNLYLHISISPEAQKLKYW